MMVALIDNGSLEPAAHRNLRSIAAALTSRAGVPVNAVSWKHSNRINDTELDHVPASILAPFVRAQFAGGERDFIFVPFFISAQGAIGSALRSDLDALRREIGDFAFTFTAGLAQQGVIPAIVAEHIRACIATHALTRPLVIVVDHGGPSAVSAALRDELAAQVAQHLGRDADRVAAASMEGAHGPLLDDALRQPEYAGRDVVVAPLFLAPGRHAGPNGDVARICRAAPSRSYLTEIVGSHPLVVDALADALRTTLSTVHAPSFA